jgi:peptidoglycan/LPS O-acetylase OafA/YrhL
MPIFFFVGGFSNLTAYESFRRRGDTTGGVVWVPVVMILLIVLVAAGLGGLERPIWILVPGAILVVIVLLVGGVERPPARRIVGRAAASV